MKREYWQYLSVVHPYVRRYRGYAGATVVFTILSALVALLEPWPLAFLIDGVLGARQLPQFVTSLVGTGKGNLILFAVVATLLLTLVTSLISLGGQYVSTKLEQNIALDFRSDLFEHCQGLSQAYHDTKSSGDFMYRINFEAHNAGSIPVALPAFAESLLTLIGMFLIACRINLQMALLALTVVPFVYYSTGLYGRAIEPKLIRVRGLEGLSLGIVGEAMSMLRVTSAFNRQRHQWRRFRKQGEDAVKSRVRITVDQTLFSLGISLLTAVGTALVIGYGAHRVLRGELTVGELLVVMAYIASMYAPLQTISSTLASFQEQFIGLQMSKQLLDTEPDVKESPAARNLRKAQGRITFVNVHFAYAGRQATLRDISFDAPAGSVVAVVGPTGAGKTTLISLIPRFYDPQSGQVLIDGVDVRDFTLRSLRHHISIVPQEPLLFSGSIADNIRYGRLDATDEEIEDAAKAANAHDFIVNLPEGYATQLAERGATLSGGERQRICIARAFIKDAPIVLLDEPTASIDSKTEAVILDALERLMVGRTTFMIAHRLSTIRRANQILVLNHGELVEQGSHQELMEREGLYSLLNEFQGTNGRRDGVPVLLGAGATSNTTASLADPIPADPIPAELGAPIAPVEVPLGNGWTEDGARTQT
ncbi:MAG TPA: ABC transporter ATP-binding protein [Acidimicrobiales bacterium]|nr:ABC transporter ATP-binding protein [Acidimicrobiales bacterium]